MSGRRLFATLGALTLAAAGLTSCSLSSAAPTTVTATFSDAGDLVTGAPVQLADIGVGSVGTISLVHNQARVQIVIDHGIEVPVDVTAKLERTTILGQRFIELVPRAGASRAHALTTGEVITHTEVVPDVEQLVQSGAEVFGAISSSDLAQIVDAGGEGFNGQEADLKSLLTSFETVTRGYAAHDNQISTAIKSLDELSSTLAPDAQANADAVTNLAATVQILAQQSQQFVNLLAALNTLSAQSDSILVTYFNDLTDQLHALALTGVTVAHNQQYLAGLLTELPLHNVALAEITSDNFVQLLDNIIVCGIPGNAGGEEPTVPAHSCDGAS